ncbi:DUF6683 family protein [uncultured Sphingomonas sp.]|uniref:DUF6683 family protein n=1 Tax=uncultured Sphingomonas sp. TaxID=158754 RepID=UPI0035C9C213
MKKLAFTIAMIASPASAQDMPVFAPSISWPEAASMSQFGLLASQARKRAAGRESTATVQPVSASDFTYAPSVVRRRVNLARFIQRSRRADPVGAVRMEKIFASTDVIAAMDRELGPHGLRIDNVADAYSVYWMNAWGAANGDTSLPSRATVQAVRAQVAETLATVPAMRDADDAVRQELAEALLVQAALISATQETYKDDPAMAAKLAAAVRKGARESGLDLDAMTLTDRGLHPAG